MSFGRRRTPTGSIRANGFTLIELMVTVSVMGVLAALAAPSFNEAILSNKLTSYANSFVASATLARSEAIKRNAVVTLCRSSETDDAACASSGGWQQGWIVLVGSTVIQRQQPLSTDYRLTGNAYSISFQPVGVGATPATLTLCRATPSAGRQERDIVVSATGRVSVEKTHVGACS